MEIIKINFRNANFVASEDLRMRDRTRSSSVDSPIKDGTIVGRKKNRNVQGILVNLE